MARKLTRSRQAHIRQTLLPIIQRVLATDEVASISNASELGEAMDLCRRAMSRDDYEELCNLMGWDPGEATDEPSEREEMAERIKERQRKDAAGEDEPSEREEMAERIKERQRKDAEGEDEPSEWEEMLERIKERKRKDEEGEDEPSEREEMARRIREREEKDRRGEDEPPYFPGRPRPGGGMDRQLRRMRQLGMDKAVRSVREQQLADNADYLTRFPNARRIGKV